MRTKIASVALWVVNGLLAVVVVFFAFEVFTAGEGGAGISPADNVSAQPASNGAAEEVSAQQIEEIISSGAIVPLPPPPPPPAPEAPAEELREVDVLANFQYDLIGTIVEPEAAYAFFQDRTGKQSVHAIGEKVGNATLVEVSDGTATLEIGGRRGEIKTIEASDRASTVPVATIASARESGARELPVPTWEEPAVETEAGQEDYAYDEELEDLDWNIISEKQYTEYVQNIGKYVSQVVVLSHYNEDKEADGLILAKVPTESEAYKRGLREGDIVKAVQGQPVTDLQAAIRAAFQVLRDNEYLVDVVIERDGVEEVLSYEVWPE